VLSFLQAYTLVRDRMDALNEAGALRTTLLLNALSILAEEGQINILASNKPTAGSHTRVHLAVPKIDFYFTGTGNFRCFCACRLLPRHRANRSATLALPSQATSCLRSSLHIPIVRLRTLLLQSRTLWQRFR
jgi:hypothetical protein